MASISNNIEFTSGSTSITVSQSIEVAGPSGSMTTMIDESTAVVMGTWGLEGSESKNIEFRIPSASFGGLADRVPFYYSSSGKIGINTKNPTKDFEISGEFKTKKRTPDTGSIIEISYDKMSQKAAVNDNMGGIKWMDENEAGDPGASAAIYSVCTHADVTGTAGDIIFLTTDSANKANPPREVAKITAAGELSASAFIGPIDGGSF